MNTAEHITLNFPIEHDGLPIQEIALRRPTVGDHPECRIYSERCIARRWFAHVPAAWPVPPDCGGHPAGGVEGHQRCAVRCSGVPIADILEFMGRSGFVQLL